MKNIPQTIYLQVDADGETLEDFKELGQVCWCDDKIFTNDIEYVLKTDSEKLARAVLDYLSSRINQDIIPTSSLNQLGVMAFDILKNK